MHLTICSASLSVSDVSFELPIPSAGIQSLSLHFGSLRSERNLGEGTTKIRTLLRESSGQGCALNTHLRIYDCFIHPQQEPKESFLELQNKGSKQVLLSQVPPMHLVLLPFLPCTSCTTSDGPHPSSSPHKTAAG